MIPTIILNVIRRDINVYPKFLKEKVISNKIKNYIMRTQDLQEDPNIQVAYCFFAKIHDQINSLIKPNKNMFGFIRSIIKLIPEFNTQQGELRR